MGSTHRFLGVGDDGDRVLDWFRELSPPPEEVAFPRGRTLYFRAIGPLVYRPSEPADTEIDTQRSPLVSFFAPRRRRGVLWTAGEVHFLPTPLKQVCPELHAVSRRFGRWLARFDLVFSRKAPGGAWDYYLEGSIRNRDSDVFALPGAMAVLREGGTFIAEEDTDEVVERLCRALRLRGVEGITDVDG
jgi:hypothetical protein